MRNRKEGKLRHVMMREMMLFIIVSLILIGLVVTAFMYSTFASNQKFFWEPFRSNKEIFEQGEFQQLAMEETFGKGSQFYVFTTDYELIYQSENAIDYPYSEKEIMLIPDEMDDLFTSWIIDKNGERLYKIEYTNVNSDIKTIVIVDASKNVVYSNIGLSGRLTENEFDCLYGNNGSYEMIKQSFTSEGKHYLAVFMFPEVLGEENLAEMMLILLVGLMIVLTGIGVTMYLYVRRFNSKVINPLSLLASKMENFSDDVESSTVEYHGPDEFVTILDKFNQLSIRLRDAEDSNKKMIADISHDLKTPISVVQLYAKIISDEDVSEGEKQSMLSTIVAKTDEMSNLINMFSDYSKLFHSGFTLHQRDVAFVDYTRNYLIGKYNDMQLQGYELAIDLPDEEIILSIDDVNFQRIYDNLLGNSVKYNDEGTIISVCVKRKEKDVIIIIGDDGIGVDSSLRDTIFDAFTVGDSARSDESGTGLGLAITRKIVGLHGGSIRLMDHGEMNLSVAFEIKVPIIED